MAVALHTRPSLSIPSYRLGCRNSGRQSVFHLCPLLLSIFKLVETYGSVTCALTLHPAATVNWNVTSRSPGQSRATGGHLGSVNVSGISDVPKTVYDDTLGKLYQHEDCPGLVPPSTELRLLSYIHQIDCV